MGQQPGLFLARKRWESNMRTSCTVSRGGVLLSPQPTMSDWRPLRCTVRADKEVQIAGADPTQTQMRWEIIFRHWHPTEIPIRALDTITAQGYVYGVDVENAPQTDGITTKCYAYALYALDAQGNPGPVLYLRFNAVVSTKRGGVVVLTDADAERVSQEIAYTPDGQVVNTVFKLVYPIDVLEGDSLTDSGYPAGIVRLVTPSPKGLPTTTILVVRPVV